MYEPPLEYAPVQFLHRLGRVLRQRVRDVREPFAPLGGFIGEDENPGEVSVRREVRGYLLLGRREGEVADEQAASLGDGFHVLGGDLVYLRLVVVGFIGGVGSFGLGFLIRVLLVGFIILLLVVFVVGCAGVVLQVVDTLHVAVDLAVLLLLVLVLVLVLVLGVGVGVGVGVAKILCRFPLEVVQVVELVVVGVALRLRLRVRFAVIRHLPPRPAPHRLRLCLLRLRLSLLLFTAGVSFVLVVGIRPVDVLVLVVVVAPVVVEFRRRFVFIRRFISRTRHVVHHLPEPELASRGSLRLDVGGLVIPEPLLVSRRGEPHELGQFRIRGDEVVDLLLVRVLLRALHLLELADADEALGVGRLELARRAFLRSLVRPAMRG